MGCCIGLLVVVVLASGQNAQSEANLLRLAAEQSDAEAQASLGVMYALGEGVPEDDVEAVKWFRLAAAQGVAEAHNWLGVMYARGEGVARNLVFAHMWLNLAAFNGLEGAREAKEAVSRKMSFIEINAAQSLATKCFESSYQQCPR